MPKRRNTKRTRKGGMDSANPSSYSDAASYALATAGPANTQWDNTFLSSRSQVPGNALVGLQGQTVGGRRKRSRSKSRSKSRSQKGGFWGGIISKALTPFTLFAIQQSYRRKKSGNQTRRRS
jgi:hypothetical protein